MSRPLADFTGSALYLGTMVFYVFLRGTHPTAQDLFVRIEAGELRAYTSVLTFDELTYRLLLALVRDRYGGSPLDRLRQQERAMIEELYPQIAAHLARLRSLPNLSLLGVTPADLEVMDSAMRNYHLRPRDALHLAAMQKCACLDLGSNDSDFDRVPAVQRYTLADNS